VELTLSPPAIRRDTPEQPGAAAAPLTVIAATYPLTVGAAPFNTAMVAAMRRRGPVDFISWRRMYPPLLYRGIDRDEHSRPPHVEPAAFMLDWHNPLTWRRALHRIERFAPKAVVLPWIHPVMAPPHRWLLRHLPSGIRRVVICHNIVQHERVRLSVSLTRSTLRHADLLVTHAPQQRLELEELGLGDIPVLEAFHPLFVPEDLAAKPSPAAIAAERARQGEPDLSLLCYGAVRPYKGVDLAIKALAGVDRALAVRLVVAGRFWEGRNELRELVDQLGLGDRVELRDRYVSNEETALLFEASDAAILPYRSATQSGVAALAFAYGRPVIATKVGGLRAAVSNGETGLLCAPEDPAALARAIERMALERTRLGGGLRALSAARSFDRYAELIEEHLHGVDR
jgi:glycosyltransferase involved in cell wall biosynthesis